MSYPARAEGLVNMDSKGKSYSKFQLLSPQDEWGGQINFSSWYNSISLFSFTGMIVNLSYCITTEIGRKF